MNSDKTAANKWDVIVAGGGLGGISAAIAAARTGAKTLLIERNTFVGGVATAGMCCSIFNCFYTSRGKLGSRGVPVEIADALGEAMGYGNAWHRHKGHIIYDLELGKLVLQTLLAEAGVELLLGATVADVIMAENQVTGLVVETKSGRRTDRAKVVVDATGDADVAFRSGTPLHVPDKEKCFAHSLCFRLGNVNVDTFIQYFRDNPDEYPAMMDVEWTLQDALRQYDECGTFLFPHGGGMQMKAFRKAKEDGALPASIGVHDTTDACQMHGMCKTSMVHVITGYVRFDGLDAEQISHAILDGRKMAFAVADVYRRYIPGFDGAFVAGVADNLGVRASRWLDGEFTLTRDMMKGGFRVDDAVAEFVPYHHEIRHPGEKAWSVQVMGDETCDLPYGCLLPRDVDGLILGAGRSASVSDPMMLRVMVHTMTIGQSAGVAAAVAAVAGTQPRETDVELIQASLKKLIS